MVKFAKYELYDLANDIGETNDLSESMPTIASEMISQFEKWMKSVMNSTVTVGCLGTAQL